MKLLIAVLLSMSSVSSYAYLTNTYKGRLFENLNACHSKLENTLNIFEAKKMDVVESVCAPMDEDKFQLKVLYKLDYLNEVKTLSFDKNCSDNISHSQNVLESKGAFILDTYCNEDKGAIDYFYGKERYFINEYKTNERHQTQKACLESINNVRFEAGGWHLLDVSCLAYSTYNSDEHYFSPVARFMSKGEVKHTRIYADEVSTLNECNSYFNQTEESFKAAGLSLVRIWCKQNNKSYTKVLDVLETTKYSISHIQDVKGLTHTTESACLTSLASLKASLSHGQLELYGFCHTLSEKSYQAKLYYYTDKL